MMTTGMSVHLRAEDGELRDRRPAQSLHLQSADEAKQRVRELNDQANKDRQDDSKKHTYGRTPDGTGMSFTPRDHEQILRLQNPSTCSSRTTN